MKYDFVIIGSGPAGSTLAWKLAQNKYKIAIIDRAIHEESRFINDFFCPYINNLPYYYSPVFSNQLGGNSALWHGKIYLISNKEFDKNKWGFDYYELKQFSDSLADELKFKTDTLTKVVNRDEKSYHYSYRSDLRNVYDYFKINNHENIDVFKGYSPIKLELDNKKVTGIEVINNQNDKKSLVINSALIFCAGGLGNPHLLMNLMSNNSEKIGKFLSDHAHVNLCKIKQDEMNRYFNILKPNIKNNIKNEYINKNEELAQVFEYKNFFAGVQLDYKIDPLRKLRRFFIRIQNIPARRFLNIFGFFVQKLNGFFAKLGLLFNKYYKYSFEFYFSQHQNSNNFVKLDEYEYDIYGLKKININWDLSSEDKKKIKYIIDYSVGYNGKLFDSNKEINFLKNFYNHGLSGLHPSCTTRIGKNQKDSVVNSDLKLHNYDNIFVCGSSVFPTNGFTNPTWTIMSLSIRLADFLKKLSS